jgi:hypothetical protein
MLLRTRRVRSLNIVTTFRLDRAKPIDADDKQLGRGVRVATQIIASQVTWRRMKNSRILHDHRSLLLRTLRGLSSHGCFGSTKIVHSGYWHRYDLMPGKCDEKGICRAGEGSRSSSTPRGPGHGRPRWLAFLFPSQLRVQGLRSVEGPWRGPTLGHGCAGRAHSASEPMGGAEKPYFVSDVHKTDM